MQPAVPYSFVASLDAASGTSGDRNAVALLAGVLDSAMDAIITVDAAQTIVLYNRAAEKIFGWPSGEAIGQPLDDLGPKTFSVDPNTLPLVTM